MTVDPSIDPARLLEEHLAQATPDLMRELLSTFINTLLSAEADAVCGAEYGTRRPERTNRRNGYRHRDLDTRAGTIDVAIPKLRSGLLLPGVAAGAPQAGRAGADLGGGDLLPARGVAPGGWTSWCSPWASPGCRSRRSRRWPRISTSRWRSSAPDRWPTPARSRSSPRTR